MLVIRRLALVGALALGGCNSDDLTSTIYPVLTITNSWVDTADSGHSFLLAANPSTDDGKMSGSFTGTERNSDGSEFELTGGRWEQGVVQFTVQRGSAVQYRGTFTTDNPTRLELDSSAGHLTLIQS